MSLFHHIQFATPDPLANGLGDEITAEQQEADAIHIMEDPTGDELDAFWSGVIKDAKKEGDWVDFAED